MNIRRGSLNVGDERQIADWREDMQIVLESKVDELHILGYEQATVDLVWDCIVSQWKKKKSEVRLHEMVNAILSLKPAQYMNYLTMENYNTSEWLSNEQLLNELLGVRE